MRTGKRFLITHKEGNSLSYPGKCVVITDTQTGMNYLCVYCGYGMAVTPLLGADGQPVVTGYTGYIEE
ncbi:MAG: hypothetical protein IKG08_01080 [Eubacterium sp.]|nr:hypothetical protein [Eubacterium sp.]